MTAETETPTLDDPAVKDAIERIDEAIDGLRNLVKLVRARPDLASSIVLRGYDINIPLGHLALFGDRDGSFDVPGRIAEIAEAAQSHGATVRQRQDGTYGGVEAMFGPFPLHVYAPLHTTGKTAMRTVEVTGWEPDPRLAAFAPAGTA